MPFFGSDQYYDITYAMDFNTDALNTLISVKSTIQQIITTRNAIVSELLNTNSPVAVF